MSYTVNNWYFSVPYTGPGKVRRAVEYRPYFQAPQRDLGRCRARPAGDHRRRHSRVALLANMADIGGEPRLVLAPSVVSETSVIYGIGH